MPKHTISRMMPGMAWASPRLIDSFDTVPTRLPLSWFTLYHIEGHINRHFEKYTEQRPEKLA